MDDIPRNDERGFCLAITICKKDQQLRENNLRNEIGTVEAGIVLSRWEIRFAKVLKNRTKWKCIICDWDWHWQGECLWATKIGNIWLVVVGGNNWWWATNATPSVAFPGTGKTVPASYIRCRSHCSSVSSHACKWVRIVDTCTHYCTFLHIDTIVGLQARYTHIWIWGLHCHGLWRFVEHWRELWSFEEYYWGLWMKHCVELPARRNQPEPGWWTSGWVHQQVIVLRIQNSKAQPVKLNKNKLF